MVLPSTNEVRAWAQVATTSLTDAQLDQIIAAEAEQLQLLCTWGDDTWPSSLAQSLLRRCAREAAARALPLGLSGDTGGEYAPVRIPNYDAEISRLEQPYRKAVLG